MAGKLSFSLQDYQEAAVKWRSDLLMLPIIGCQDTLQYMTGRPGIRYKEQVGAINGTAQFGPYKPSRSTDFNLNIDFRTLETYFGSVVAKFEPNSAISTLLGTGATKGDGQMTVPTAKHVLALIAKSLSEHLNNAIWSGKRNAAGDTVILADKSQLTSEAQGEIPSQTQLNKLVALHPGVGPDATDAAAYLNNTDSELLCGILYNIEELVAELTAAMVAQYYGMDKHIKEDSAAYLKSWLQSLKEDASFIKTVLLDVKRAAGMLTLNIDTVKNTIEAAEAA